MIWDKAGNRRDEQGNFLDEKTGEIIKYFEDGDVPDASDVAEADNVVAEADNVVDTRDAEIAAMEEQLVFASICLVAHGLVAGGSSDAVPQTTIGS